jgi:23S rRNA pseudouridine2604 synthase
LKQGLNRQIRRMCNLFGYQVIKLQRIRIMNIKLGKLKTGEWRNLTEEEISKLVEQLS